MKINIERGTLVKLKCNFDFKFKNPPRVLPPHGAH